MTEPQTTIAAPPVRKRSSGLPPERRGDSAPSTPPKPRKRQKSDSSIKVKDGEVWVRLPDDAGRDYLETAAWLRSTGVGMQHVDVPVVNAVGAALTGKTKTLAQGSVMRAFETTKPEGFEARGVLGE